MFISSWEASAALKKFLASRGIRLEGAPGGWAEVVRVFKECKVFGICSFETVLMILFSSSKMRVTSFSSKMPLDWLSYDLSSLTILPVTQVLSLKNRGHMLHSSPFSYPLLDVSKL